MPEGSWKCEKCNNINYPFRTKCNRQNCGADKPAESEKSSSPSPDQNDEVCCVKHFHFANLRSFLLQLMVFHEQLCDIVNIFKWKAVVKWLIMWIRWTLWKSLTFASCHLDPFVQLTDTHTLISFPLYLFIAIFNLQLFTVPVSTRTCLGVEKVQSCGPALLNLGV